MAVSQVNLRYEVGVIMNILKRECKVNLKVFLFWILGLLVLIFAGMTKYTGLNGAAGGTSINDLLSQIPKVVLAVFGMAGVDITTLAGYYSVIVFYVLICGIIYSVHLGANAVSREVIDKTYEFIFTKPCSKKYVLGMKVLAGWLAIVGFTVMSMVFSYASVAALGTEENMNELIILYGIVVFILSSLFYAFTIFFATASNKAEKGMLYGNLSFLLAFIMGIVHDMLDNGTVIKWISPLKYFEANDLIAGKLDGVFLIVCLCLTVVLLVFSFERFQQNDLQAS
ncbi:MAG: hypothetical protein K0R92_119 [Lachnospiraceae bacterium]|jgi:ABC-2 type transport system permease protein|nr:hypothetical protein [Lachnospiraceae bacterium]